MLVFEYAGGGNLKEYLESQPIKDIVTKTMASFHPTKQLFKSIPDLPDAK